MSATAERIHPGWLADPAPEADVVAWPVEVDDRLLYVEHPERFHRGDVVEVGTERMTVERVYGSRLTVRRERPAKATYPLGMPITIAEVAS